VEEAVVAAVAATEAAGVDAVLAVEEEVRVAKGELEEARRVAEEAREAQVFFFFTLVAGPRRSLSLKLSDTRVYEP